MICVLRMVVFHTYMLDIGSIVTPKTSTYRILYNDYKNPEVETWQFQMYSPLTIWLNVLYSMFSRRLGLSKHGETPFFMAVRFGGTNGQTMSSREPNMGSSRNKLEIEALQQSSASTFIRASSLRFVESSWAHGFTANIRHLVLPVYFFPMGFFYVFRINPIIPWWEETDSLDVIGRFMWVKHRKTMS